ncbi:helix-turn-helix domain-containing protein [Candidatus Pacearchaeota archaeon]|nr:helix-turn-helix domain-containing protein [Candidatus Pacearchaeota archaeon]
MQECYKCGISEDKAVLLDVVMPEGIVKICRNCASSEGAPLVKSTEERSMHTPTVYERLIKLSGVDRRKTQPIKVPEKSNKELKNLVEENFTKSYKDNVYVKDALIKNFQWIVMRARRMRHITQEQLAIAINEPEVVIKFLEEGKIKDINVIEKVENYLGVTLRKEPRREIREYGNPDSTLSLKEEIDFKDTKNLTISQLQDMKKKREAEELAERQKKIDDEMDKEMKGK